MPVGQGQTAGIDYSNLGPIVPLWYARPVIPVYGTFGLDLSATLAYAGLFDLPFRMQLSQVSYRVSTGGVAGVRVGIYDNFGNMLFQILGSGVVGTQSVTVDVSLTPQTYYVLVCHDNTGAAPFLRMWQSDPIDLLNQNVPIGTAPVEGTLAIANGVLPNSFDPMTITPLNNRTAIVRFD